MNRLDYVDCILDTATLEWDFNETPWTVRKVAEADTVGHLKKSQKDINRFNGAYDGDPGLGLKIISKNFKNIFQDFKRLENSILILIWTFRKEKLLNI